MTMTQITTVSAPVLVLSQRRSAITLPDEILIQIFLKLAPWDLENGSLVSKQWHCVSNDATLWQLFAEIIYPLSQFMETEEEAIEQKQTLMEKQQELTPDQLLALKKQIIHYYKTKLKDDSFLETHKVKHVQFNEPALQVLYSYALCHRERIILFPEYLMAMKELRLSLYKMDYEEYKLNFCKKDIHKENIFDLFINFNEEELIFHFCFDLNITNHLENKIILSEDLFKFSPDDKLNFFPVLRIFKRLLDKGCYSLVAANLFKCDLYFEVKLEIISNLIQCLDGLSWFRRSIILSTLVSNLNMDDFLSLNQRKQILDMLNAAQRVPIVLQKISMPLENKSLGFYKIAHFALTFFKKGCLFVGGLTAAVLIKGWIISPYFITPLSLKIFIFAGLFFVGIKVLEKALETSSDHDLNALIDQALECVDSSQNYKVWKQKLADQGVLNPFIYRACQAAKVSYRHIDGLQAEWEVYEIFYALHFAIDQFANTQESRFSVRARSKLFNLVGFLDQWCAEKLAEIFVKRDDLYQNPSYFKKQKYREALATLRTKEALQIYDIKKRAREIGLEFSETNQIKEYKEKIEEMAAATKNCSSLDEWIALLEKRNLLKDLLKLAQPNIPPSYRCVSSGKLLFSAVSYQGNFYDVKTFDELRKLEKNDLPFVREYETSSQLYSAINQVFRNHFVLFGSTNQVIIDCVNFLHEEARAQLSNISKIELPQENAEKESAEVKYRSCRLDYSGLPSLRSSQLRKIKQSAIPSERQVEFSANVISESL